MKPTPALLLALLTPFLVVWTAAVDAANCANGKTLYNKVVNSMPACGNTNCHKANVSANKIANGAGNASAIDSALNTVTEMVANNVRGTLGLTPSDIDDLAEWIFFGNAGQNCPAAAPALSASPSSWSFGSGANGSTSAANLFTVTNAGSANATGVTYTNSANTKWLVTGSTCGATIAVGASCSFSIAYKPAAASANDSGTYSSSGTGGFSISLSGSSPAGATPANLTATPGSAAFGSITVGSSSAAQAITIRNTGTTGATGMAFTNSNSARFAISGQSCGTTLAGGATCGFNLTYTPSAVAADSGTLTVAYAGGALAMGLTGAGVAVAPPPPPPPPTVQTVDLVEYFHASFGHYFVTYLQGEITKLDDGTFAGWARTGRQFKAWTSSAAGLSAVCRFFTTAFPPKSSHFYTPNAPECSVVKSNAVWQFEGEVFYTQQPSVTGVCPSNTVPVYRMYNNGQSGAPNHRYTTDLSVRTQMLAQGWVPEGAGTIGVIMCSPP